MELHGELRGIQCNCSSTFGESHVIQTNPREPLWRRQVDFIHPPSAIQRIQRVRFRETRIRIFSIFSPDFGGRGFGPLQFDPSNGAIRVYSFRRFVVELNRTRWMSNPLDDSISANRNQRWLKPRRFVWPASEGEHIRATWTSWNCELTYIRSLCYIT